MVERYWNLLTDSLFKYACFSEYRKFLNRISQSVNLFNALLAFVAIGGYFAASSLVWLWGVFIVISGAMTVIIQQFGISEKLAALKYYLPLLDKQINEMREEWREMAYVYEYSEADASECLSVHEKALSDLSFTYLDCVELPSFAQWERAANEYVSSVQLQA
jgi:hypothetical protein